MPGELKPAPRDSQRGRPESENEGQVRNQHVDQEEGHHKVG